jgi:hypothetical protein
MAVLGEEMAEGRRTPICPKTSSGNVLNQIPGFGAELG